MHEGTKIINGVSKSSGTYEEIGGNLITLAQGGEFDVIAHGCNINCVMGAGIAPQMAKAFKCDEFALEGDVYRGDYNKLGQIDWDIVNRKTGERDMYEEYSVDFDLVVVNCYTQTLFGRNHSNGVDIPLDYEALILCLRKMNHEFVGKRIGLPMIGCGLAGGDWGRVKQIIKQELKDCYVTVVIYNKK